MNARDERILKDLTDHLREKLARNVADFRALCESADLEARASSAEAMTMLMQLTAAYAVIHYNISAADFARVMGTQFQQIQEQQAEDDE
jgi:hypothetical protein